MSTELRMPADAVRTLQDHLLQDDRERIAFCRCEQSGDAFLLTAVDPVPDDDMAIMAPDRCAATADADRRFIQQCFQHDQHPVILHSHPSDLTRFSATDRDAVAAHADWITDLDDAVQCLFGVLSPDTVYVEQYDRDTETFNPLPVTIIGDWTLNNAPTPVTGSENTPEVDTELYDRAIRCFLEAGQHRLADTHVAIVGCGGIGSLLAQTVAGLGVQQVTFIDPDRLENTNIPRIPQAGPGDAGRYKTAVLQKDYLRQIPDAVTATVTTPVQDAAAHLQNVDVILAGLDRVTPRMWLNRYATQHLTYYIDAGSRIDIDENDRVTDMAAYVQLIAPGAGTACFDCLDRGDTEAMRREHLSQEELEEEVEQGYIADTALSPEPAVNHLNGLAANLAAETFTKLVTGYDAPPTFLHYDGLRNDLARLTTHCSDTCYTCTQYLATGDTTVAATGDTDRATKPDLARAIRDPDTPTDTSGAVAADQKQRRQQEYRIPDAVSAFFAFTP